jgi:leader peptidase (prepilin peptidase)/N-methyltransferase
MRQSARHPNTLLPMSETTPALIAGILGIAAGSAARILVRRHCEPRLPLRPPLLEAAMGGVWALLALRVWPAHPAALPAYLALAFVCATLAVIDLDTKLLPDRITYPAFALVALLLLVASLVEHDLGRMLRALEAAALACAGLLALVFISPGGMGRGDALTELLGGPGPGHGAPQPGRRRPRSSHPLVGPVLGSASPRAR